MQSTATKQHSYLLGHEDRELERLSRQADFYAPLTEQALRPLRRTAAQLLWVRGLVRFH